MKFIIKENYPFSLPHHEFCSQKLPLLMLKLFHKILASRFAGSVPVSRCSGTLWKVVSLGTEPCACELFALCYCVSEEGCYSEQSFCCIREMFPGQGEGCVLLDLLDFWVHTCLPSDPGRCHSSRPLLWVRHLLTSQAALLDMSLSAVSGGHCPPVAESCGLHSGEL